jgi:peptidoglycan/LPS O-acetylase OafA/YrhL
LGTFALMTYRYDIDGLRAFAVLSVIGFHYFGVQAGFIGVDIFFVISGYLISTIIYTKLSTGSFSVSSFYLRRIKRIFPSLLTVLFSCFIVGWFVLLATEFEQLNKHITAGLTFTSNLVLFAESGYFDADSHTKILLHLWSLGVEEQFYIFWPLVLIVCWRYRNNLLSPLITLLVTSFAVNIYLVSSHPSADFYLPFSRFWELLIGSLLAYRITVQNKTLHLFNSSNITSAVGALVLVVCNILVNDRSPFPGWWALLPTIGAALIISGGGGACFNRILLNNRLMVWIGVISYPLYLWHWPLLAFARILGGGKQSPTLVRIAMFFLAFFLAWLTYRFIEKPFRFGRATHIKMGGLISIALILLGSSVYVLVERGLPFRAANELTVLNKGDIGHDEFMQYFSSQKNIHGINDCEIAVVGDSHGSTLTAGLAEAVPAKNFCFFSTDQTLPFYSSKNGNVILKEIDANPKIHTVILLTYWNLRMPLIPNGSSFSKEIINTADTLSVAGKKIMVVDGIPNFSFYPTVCKFDWPLIRRQQCAEKYFFRAQYLQYKSDFDFAKNNSKVNLIDLNGLFCSDEECNMAKEGRLLFRDENHLNINGSRLIAEHIAAFLN